MRDSVSVGTLRSCSVVCIFQDQRFASARLVLEKFPQVHMQTWNRNPIIMGLVPSLAKFPIGDPRTYKVFPPQDGECATKRVNTLPQLRHHFQVAMRAMHKFDSHIEGVVWLVLISERNVKPGKRLNATPPRRTTLACRVCLVFQITSQKNT